MIKKVKKINEYFEYIGTVSDQIDKNNKNIKDQTDALINSGYEIGKIKKDIGDEGEKVAKLKSIFNNTRINLAAISSIHDQDISKIKDTYKDMAQVRNTLDKLDSLIKLNQNIFDKGKLAVKFLGKNSELVSKWAIEILNYLHLMLDDKNNALNDKNFKVVKEKIEDMIKELLKVTTMNYSEKSLEYLNKLYREKGDIFNEFYDDVNKEKNEKDEKDEKKID